MKNKIKTRNGKLTNQIRRLALILGMGGLTGIVSIASLAGLFKIENAFANSILFIAGPGAIITALTLEGEIKQRIFAALIACIIATIIIIIAAGIGTLALSFLNIGILKISGGIAVLIIGLIIMGIKIPDNTPIMIIIIGMILGVILR